MINALLQTITKFLLSIVLFVSNLFITPLYWILGQILPDFSTFIETAGDFFDTYIVTGLAFAKELFFNLTGFPRALVSAIVLYYTGLYTFKLFRRPLLFLYRNLVRIGLIH